MNLSPEWARVLNASGWEAIHWRDVGDAGAADTEIMRWARDNGWIVFTHDLDFGTILAASGSRSPSVLQFRNQRLLPEDAQSAVVAAFRQFETLLAEGALVTVDETRARARVLPIHARRPSNGK